VKRIPLIGAGGDAADALPVLCRRVLDAPRVRRGHRLGVFPGSGQDELAPNTVSGSDTFPAGRESWAQGEPVDGIQCGSTEQLVVHYHAHLAIFAHGRLDAIPEGVGRVGPLVGVPTPNGPFGSVTGPPGTCLYWVHVHDQTGMIHMELPANITVTLGDFFDIWGQPLSSTQAGPQRRAVTAFVNGARYSGDQGNIVLRLRAPDSRITIAPTPRGWCLE
jgi:hypothetical protein